MLITVNSTTSRPPVPSILQILTTFYLYSGRPRTGLSVNNKQKIRQAVVRGGGFMVFPRPFTHGGFPLIWGECRGQSVNGRTHEGDIDFMGGPNFDRLYHKLKVLLSCNYMMQFISYDSIKTG